MTRFILALALCAATACAEDDASNNDNGTANGDPNNATQNGDPNNATQNGDPNAATQNGDPNNVNAQTQNGTPNAQTQNGDPNALNGPVMTCGHLCDQTSVASTSEAECVAQYMNDQGYDLLGNLQCAAIGDSPTLCNQCMTALQASDEDCAGAWAMCDE